MRMAKIRLFGTSGIRGIVGKELTPDFCRDAGRAIGTVLTPGSKICIATDTRISREIIREAVTSGLLSSGIDVTHLGILPTPALAFLTKEMDFDAGLMITASHNPPEYNGIKIFNNDTIGYSVAQEDEIEAVFRRKNFRAGRGTSHQDAEAKERYLARLIEVFSGKTLSRGLKVVVDPGNGAASGFASRLFTELGFDVIPINDEPDGRFPGRPSEPTSETLRGTIEFLREKRADLAVCFDGDADRVVFCDREGFIGFNEMVAFISRLFVEESGKKTVAATIDVGKLLDLALEDLGAKVVRGKVGDVHLAHLVREQNAAIGVEDIGVYIIPEMGWYPESMFAALSLLSRITSPIEIRDFLKRLPRFFHGKQKVGCPNNLKEAAMDMVKEKASTFKPKELNFMDGIRLDFEDSWMLIRASGTEPAIRIMTEASEEARAEELLSKGVRLVEEIVRGFGSQESGFRGRGTGVRK
ncbi:MAG: hypothetical protein WC749_09270 [Dehalococcoidia bacterium]